VADLGLSNGETLLVRRPDVRPPAGAPPASLPSLLLERQQFSIPSLSPSSLGVPSEFLKLQWNQDQKIVWSRPTAADSAIPVTLLHPIFRQFVDNCRNHQPIQEDNNLALELTGAMSNFFPDEEERAAAFRHILTRHGIPVSPATIRSKGLEFYIYGSIANNGQLVAIVEVREEIGSKGTRMFEIQLSVLADHRLWTTN